MMLTGPLRRQPYEAVRIESTQFCIQLQTRRPAIQPQ